MEQPVDIIWLSRSPPAAEPGNNNVDARCDSWLETMKDIEERINKLDE